MKTKIDDARRWKKQNPDFPLFPHGNGQWAKKVDGKLHYFGPVGNREAAMRLWMAERDYILAGVRPPDHDAITIGRLFDAHLACVDDKVASGALAPNTRRGYAMVRRVMEQAGIAMSAPVGSLGPKKFSELSKWLRVRYSAGTMGQHVRCIKAVLRWGVAMRICKAVDWGPDFLAPGAAEIGAERDDRGASRWIDRDAILSILHDADHTLRLAVLFGVNCGFYPVDTITITLDRLHLDGEIPYHDYRRAKTGQRRMAALWPETVSAIREYVYTSRPAGCTQRVLMVTRRGEPLSGNSIDSVIGTKFRAALSKFGGYPRGAGIGSLRHVYGTVVDLVPDQAIIDLTMGHSGESLQKRVYSQFHMNFLNRLKVVADTVRLWLFYGRMEAANANS